MSRKYITYIYIYILITYIYIFFFNYIYIFLKMWCMATTEINEAASANVDDHSPNKFRILGTVTNMATFSDAFNCPANSPLNPNTKCTLWK